MSVASTISEAAAELTPLRIEDLYRTDAITSAITLADGRSAIYCRFRTDPAKRTAKQSLWRVDDQGPPRPLEPGEPDVFSPQPSPDGKWILFLSTRAFDDGTRAFDLVPPYSDSAADIWLIPIEGGKAVPLGGPAKPYGRVITDSFYARVAFSPNGKRLVFVADERRDLKTDAERRNNVVIVREDQGEGYKGYGPMQVWVADLLDAPNAVAATHIARVTPGDCSYGDPQWSPDGSFLVVHANRTADQKAVRFNISRSYDLWRIDVADCRIEQLTAGTGPEFSSRISPDGRRIVCLSSPRNGPHIDVFNLMLIELTATGAKARVVFDHHCPATGSPPHLPPSSLPQDCWRDNHHVVFSAFRGLKAETECVDLGRGPEAIAFTPATPSRSPLLPLENPELGKRLKAQDEFIHWTSFGGQEIEGILTVPPTSIATNRNQWYVAISRARKRVVVFTSDKAGLRENIQHDGERELALELNRVRPATQPSERIRRPPLTRQIWASVERVRCFQFIKNHHARVRQAQQRRIQP